MYYVYVWLYLDIIIRIRMPCTVYNIIINITRWIKGWEKYDWILYEVDTDNNYIYS